MLLSSTNDALSPAAKLSNKYVQMSKKLKPKPVLEPYVRASQSDLLDASNNLMTLLAVSISLGGGR